MVGISSRVTLFTSISSTSTKAPSRNPLTSGYILSTVVRFSPYSSHSDSQPKRKSGSCSWAKTTLMGRLSSFQKGPCFVLYAATSGLICSGYLSEVQMLPSSPLTQSGELLEPGRRGILLDFIFYLCLGSRLCRMSSSRVSGNCIRGYVNLLSLYELCPPRSMYLE